MERFQVAQLLVSCGSDRLHLRKMFFFLLCIRSFKFWGLNTASPIYSEVKFRKNLEKKSSRCALLYLVEEVYVFSKGLIQDPLMNMVSHMTSLIFSWNKYNKMM
jgi:hypothetical protein